MVSLVYLVVPVVLHCQTSNCLVLAKHGNRLEKQVLATADIYAAGYKNVATANLAHFGLTLGAPFLPYTIIHYLTQDENDDAETKKKKTGNALFAGLGALLIVFVGIKMFRREKMLLHFVGENMTQQYVKLFLIPFVVGTIGIKVASSSLTIQKSAIFSAFAAGTITLTAKKLYFVSKINDLEKGVFLESESLLTKCTRNSKSSCGHKHADYLNLLTGSLNKSLKKIKVKNRMSQAFKPLEVIKFLAQKQTLDTAQGYIKTFT